VKEKQKQAQTQIPFGNDKQELVQLVFCAKSAGPIPYLKIEMWGSRRLAAVRWAGDRYRLGESQFELR
jgi:hypothetical protein